MKLNDFSVGISEIQLTKWKNWWEMNSINIIKKATHYISLRIIWFDDIIHFYLIDMIFSLSYRWCNSFSSHRWCDSLLSYRWYNLFLSYRYDLSLS